MAVPLRDPRATLLAIAARCTGATPRMIERAWTEKRSIVCIIAMRGAKYLVNRALAPAMLSAYRQVSLEGARKSLEASGVDLRAVAAAELRVLDVVRSSDGPLTVSAIAARSQVDPKISESAAKLLTASGTLILAGRTGGWRSLMHEIDLTERWLPKMVLPDPAAARSAIAAAYVASYGPATLDDFVHWSSLPRVQAKAALVACGAVFRAGKYDAKPQKPQRKERAWPSQQVRLVPVGDPVASAWKNPTRFIAPARAAHIFDKKSTPTGLILAGGKAVGTWTFREGPKLWAQKTPGAAIQHEWTSLRQIIRSADGVTV
ncbi:MAG: winged helix DNA-binding domain-containing protein [Planctomycetes bacterium]|nr:winged helix DNA-binding domain-containing protein [Planctomycetota bacterium]